MHYLAMKDRNKKILIYSILCLLLLLSFVRTIVPLRSIFWWDETVYLQNAETIFSHRTNYNEFDFRPPLLPLFIAFSYLFAHNSFAPCIVVALLGVLGPLFAFLIGKKLYGENAGLIACAFLALSPFVVLNAHFIMTDVPSLSFLCVSIYFLVLANKNQKSVNYLLCGLFFALAILMKFTSLILLFILPIYFLINRNEIKKAPWLIFGFAIPLLPYLIWAQITQGFFLKPFILAQGMVTGEVQPANFYIVNFFEVFPFVMFLGFIVWLFSAIFFLLQNKNNLSLLIAKEKCFEILFLSWIILFFIYLTWTPHKEPRYIIPLFLPFALLSSKGLAVLMKNKNKLFNYATSALIIILIIFTLYPNIQKLSSLPIINHERSSEMDVSDYILKNYPANITLYARANWPVLAYYSGLKIEILPLTNTEAFYDKMNNTLQKDGIIIINEMLDKYPTKEFMDKNSKFKFVNKINEDLIYEFKQSSFKT